MCISDEVDSDEWDLVESEYDPAADHSGEDDHKEDVKGVRKNQLKQNLKEEAIKLYEVKKQSSRAEQIRELERVVLESYRQKWMDHIDDMEQLRQVSVCRLTDREIRKPSTR